MVGARSCHTHALVECYFWPSIVYLGGTRAVIAQPGFPAFECSLPCLARTTPQCALSVFVCCDRKLKGQAFGVLAKVPTSSGILFHEFGPRTPRRARCLLKLIDHQTRVDESSNDLSKGVIRLVICRVSNPRRIGEIYVA